MTDRQSERRFFAAIPDALNLVAAVHSGNDSEVREALDGVDPSAVAVVLAGLVDQDRSVSDLLAWASRAPRVPLTCDPTLDHAGSSRSAHGSRARYNAGCRGDACTAAERDYSRAAKRRAAVTA